MIPWLAVSSYDFNSTRHRSAALQKHAAPHRGAKHRIAVRSAIVNHDSSHCNTQQHAATRSNTKQHEATRSNTKLRAEPRRSSPNHDTHHGDDAPIQFGTFSRHFSTESLLQSCQSTHMWSICATPVQVRPAVRSE